MKKSHDAIHVLPALGAIPLQRLTPEHLDTFYAELLRSGRQDGSSGGLSVKTVRNVHAMLHKALAYAARKGTVPRNVAVLADPLKLSSVPRPEMRVWDADQLRQFLAEMEDHRLYPAFFLLANTGMRRGELLGLRWKDVDLERATISALKVVSERLGHATRRSHSRFINTFFPACKPVPPRPSQKRCSASHAGADETLARVA